MPAVSERAVQQVMREVLFSIEEVRDVIGDDYVGFWMQGRRFIPPPPPALHIRETFGIISEIPEVSQTTVIGSAIYAVRVANLQGSEAAKDLAFAMVDCFQRRGSIVGQGVTVYIERAERSELRQEDDAWSALPVRVTWRAHSFESKTIR